MGATPSLSGGQGKVALGPQSIKSVAAMRRNATKAYNRLAKISGGEVVELLHEEQQAFVRHSREPAQG